jgi:hydrogenase-4 component E
MQGSRFALLFALDALTGALFLLTALGVVGTRQVLASVQLFILQSLLLTASAILLGVALGSVHLLVVAAITVGTKTFLIPSLLRHTVSAEVYRTREIERVLNVPPRCSWRPSWSSWPMSSPRPWSKQSRCHSRASTCRWGSQRCSSARSPSWCGAKRCHSCSGFCAGERRVLRRNRHRAESAGDCRARGCGRVPVVALVVGLLTRRIHQRLGTTAVGRLAALREP